MPPVSQRCTWSSFQQASKANPPNLNTNAQKVRHGVRDVCTLAEWTSLNHASDTRNVQNISCLCFFVLWIPLYKGKTLCYSA